MRAATAEQRRQERLNRPPTWGARDPARRDRGGGALRLLRDRVQARTRAGARRSRSLAALLYMPAFHLTDTLLYRNRMRRRERERGPAA